MASWVRGRHVRLQEALEPQQADRGDRYAVLEHAFASATLYLCDSEGARYSAATRQAQLMEALIRCTVEIKAPFSAAVLRMLTPAASFSGKPLPGPSQSGRLHGVPS
jgi:hypothetical protein